MRPLCYLILFCVFLAGCGKKDTEISQLKDELEALKKKNEAAELEKKIGEMKGGIIKGSVFVVTKGGTNYKLGLVSVGIADESVMGDYVKRVSESLKKDLGDSVGSYKQAVVDFGKAKLALDPVADQYAIADVNYEAAERRLREIASHGSGNSWDLLFSQSKSYGATAMGALISFDKKRAKLGQEVLPLYNRAREASDKVQRLKEKKESLLGQYEVSMFVSNFPAQQTTKTDADGNFSFSVTKGKTYFLVAGGQREVGNSTEKYYWVAKVSLPGQQDSASVMLSNDNLVETPWEVGIQDPRGDGSEEVEVLPYTYMYPVTKEGTGWQLKDDDGNVVTVNVPTDAAVPGPMPAGTPPGSAKSRDTTKFPRECLAKRRIAVFTDTGAFAVPPGSYFDLISKDGDKFKGRYHDMDFDLTQADFEERP